MTYQLWYWPGIPGRGEFVRLALEAGQILYRDIAMESEDGADKLIADLDKPRDARPFAPPYLITGDMVIAQVANILLYLGEQHALAPQDMAGRLWVHQVQLTIADMVAEAHDVHHPVGSGLYYEDQKAAAARKADDFRKNRILKYLNYFERILAHRGDWIAGVAWSYADLSLFHLIEGLRFAFPKRMASVARDCPKVMALRETVTAIPNIAAYIASGRRQPFGNGIFRYYPELDAA